MQYFLIVIMVTMLAGCGGSSGTNNTASGGDVIVTVQSFANLSSAKASPLTAGKEILITRAETVNNLTIPADRTLKIQQGGSLSVNSGKTFVLNGPFSAGQYQVFTGSGAVVFNSPLVNLGTTSWFGVGQQVTANGFINVPPTLISTNFVLGATASAKNIFAEWTGGVTPNDTRPISTYRKIYASTLGISRINIMTFGDSVAGLKYFAYSQPLAKLLGAAANYVPNGTLPPFSAGMFTFPYFGSGWSWLTGQYTYWPSGELLSFPPGATADFKNGGVDPKFTKLSVYYIKESGGGTFTVSVGGSVVGTVDTNNTTIGLGIFTYPKAVGQAKVTITSTSGTCKIVEAHVINETISGLNWYKVATGGLALNDAMSTSTARANLQTYLADIDLDMLTFEMKETSTYGDTSTYDGRLKQLFDLIDAGAATADKIMIGSTPVGNGQNDADQVLQNSTLKANSLLRGYIYWDGYSPVVSYENLVALGWQGDGVHVDWNCSMFLANLMFSDLGFDSLL
ncbi:MAG: hypothetical protein IPQ16_11090 [Geobacteraceae bacterium]|nr:hypothetical protein [Geobacteraceae bacterium]